MRKLPADRQSFLVVAGGLFDVAEGRLYLAQDANHYPALFIAAPTHRQHRLFNQVAGALVIALQQRNDT